MDNEDVGKPVSDYFGVSDGPTVIFFFIFYFDISLSSFVVVSMGLLV